jgi:hypothetical protein
MESITFAVNNSVLFDDGVYFLALKATFAISWRDDGPNAQPCKLRTYGLCLKVSEYRTGARFRAKIFQLPVGRLPAHNPVRVVGE